MSKTRFDHPTYGKHAESVRGTLAPTMNTVQCPFCDKQLAKNQMGIRSHMRGKHPKENSAKVAVELTGQRLY